MLERIESVLQSPKFKQLIDVRNIGLYIFTLIVLAVFWSGVKTIQTNYQLQRKIARLQQENEVKKLENDNLRLKNEYLKTDHFLELAARRQFGKAAPGETVYTIPKEVALSYITMPKEEPIKKAAANNENKSQLVKNLESWKNFLTGKVDPDTD